MVDLLKTAKTYKKYGLSVIATNDHKQPIFKWARFQMGIASNIELEAMFQHPAAKGVAIICGKVSGGLEVVDIDCKNDINRKIFENLMIKIGHDFPTILPKLVVSRTKNQGYHLLYRCERIGNNTILARRIVTANEKMLDSKEKIKVLIETRGEGGYVVAPPTNGYVFIQYSLQQLPIISSREREQIFECARYFNQYMPVPVQRRLPATRLSNPDSPFIDYDERGDVIELLQQHGWKVVNETSVKTVFKRPGNTDSRSSGDYNHQLGLFTVFTTSTEFEPLKGYRPYAVFAILECQGDFRLAARKLLEQGYGISYVEKRLQEQQNNMGIKKR